MDNYIRIVVADGDHDIVRHFDMDDVDIHYHLHNHCALDCV
jgi:hypothetical protein